MTPHTIIDCGWGRLLMGQTFASQRDLVEALIAETPQQRDVALYAHDPHVLVALAPQQLFLDPSHTFRLTLSDAAAWPVQSFLKHYRHEFEYMIDHGGRSMVADQLGARAA